MKKIFAFTFILILSINSYGQALEKGDFVISPFAGYPNWGKFFAERTMNDDFLGFNEYENNSTSGVAPIGLNLEFMLSDEFSFTLGATYNSWSAEWDQSVEEYVVDSTGNGSYVYSNYSFKYGMQRFRVQVGINYHYSDIENEDLDVYGGFAIGTNNKKFTEFRNDGGKVSDPFYAFSQNAILTLPVSARLRVGGRYKFTDNFLLNMELGLGGPLIMLGVSLKFASN